MLELDYKDLYPLSINNVEDFWNEIAKEVTWSKPYTEIVKEKFSNAPRWFVGGEINMSYNCLDRHVEGGYGEDVAVIHDSPITGSTRSITYRELLTSVELLAGVMVDQCGMKKGDIAMLYFPMIPECLIGMLACTRIGVTYALSFGEFSVKVLGKRIESIKPKLILTCNAGPEPKFVRNYKDRVDNALKLCTFQPKKCIIFNRPNFKPAFMKAGFDLDWTSEVFNAKPHGPVSLESSHPLSIIFTSGTTGAPKGLVFSTAGAVVYNNYLIKHAYGMKPQQTMWIISHFAWIVGQTLMTYGPLLTRVRTIFYEGKLLGTPDNRQFARVLNWHKVDMVLTVVRFMKALKVFCSDEDLELNYKGLSYIDIGGEVSDPRIREWVSKKFDCQVYNSWGQTEYGGSLGRSVYKIKSSQEDAVDNSVLLPIPSLNFKILDIDTGKEVSRGDLGRIVLKLPILPQVAQTFHNNEIEFQEMYLDRYPGFFDTMDVGVMRENGAIKVVSRCNDIIWVGTARICPSDVEETCLLSEDITDAVVVQFFDDNLGPVPFTFLIRKPDVTKSDDELIEESLLLILENIGEAPCFKKVVVAHELPMVTSGKIHRKSLVAMVNCQEYEIPTSVTNSYVYPILHALISKRGYKSSLPTPSS